VSDLKSVVTKAYHEMVIQRGNPVSAMAMFQHKRDELEPLARSRLASLRRVEKQCFLARHEMEFLQKAIASPVIDSTALLPKVHLHTKQDEDMTSKLKALAGLAKSTVAQVEADAEAAVNRLQAAQQKAHSGVDKINSVAGEIEDSAASLEDFANQITNGGPPL
jgi:hypothetical protein